MKNLSLIKIIAALTICCIYLYTCAVIGTVPEDKDAVLDMVSEPEINNEHNKGTEDFLAPDFLDTQFPDSTESEENSVENIETELRTFGTASLSQRPLKTKVNGTNILEKLELTQTASSENSDTSESEPEEHIVFGEPYESNTSEYSVSESTPDIIISKPETSIQQPEPDTGSSESSIPDDSVSSSSEAPENYPEPDPPETTEPESSEPESSEPENVETESSEPEEIVPEQPIEIVTDATAANEILTVNDFDTGMVSGKAIDIVSRIVANEIGGAFAPEAIKAQAVAAYSYIKYFNERDNYPSVLLEDNVPDSIRVLVASVIGQAVYYDGEIIQAVYSASSAGYTASAANVWGNDVPYLQSVFCELDEEYDPNYGHKATFTSSEIKSNVYNACGITLEGDPYDWFEIIDRLDGKYVGKMTIGGYDSYIDSDGDETEITGRVFRERIMGFDIRSTAFDIDYDETTDEFTITTYGYGHGVGMSENGADNLATYWGWDYKQILEFYYTGAYIQ